MTFAEKLAVVVKKTGSLLCIGLDPDVSKLPGAIAKLEDPQYEFNKAIIDATADLVCTYKPNSAFYESQGASGITQLKKTCDYLRENHPEIPILLDYKRGDIGNTNEHYARFAFEYLQADAVTISPYMGYEANKPFIDYHDKGIMVLCRTSNPGGGEFQDLVSKDQKLYQTVAKNVAQKWNTYKNCHLVMGATYPEELAWARKTVGDNMLFLVPGSITQGGVVEQTVKAGVNTKGDGLIINFSREIIFAADDENFAQAARHKALALSNEINSYR